MSETIYLEVKGMHCPDCPAKIERTVNKMNGVIEIKVDYETEKGFVKFDSQLTSISDIINKIGKMGFEVETEIG